jgi:hypothetical protein
MPSLPEFSVSEPHSGQSQTDISSLQGITQNAFDKKRLQLETEKQIINQQFVEYSLDDSDFRESFITLLQVVSKAASLFKSSKVERQRKILSLVFSNIWLDGQNVRYELNKPFDKLVVNLGRCKEWWAQQDSNLQPTDYESGALTIEL